MGRLPLGSTYTESVLQFEEKQSLDVIDNCCKESATSFKKLLCKYAIFHSSFFLLLVLETLCLLFLSFFYKLSYFIPITLAGVFLTLFSYFVLLYYFQIRKSQQFIEIKNFFLHIYITSCQLHPDQPGYHLAIATAVEKLATHLYENHYTSKKANSHQPRQNFAQKYLTFLLKKDLISMQKLLLFESIKEHIALIKQEPTDLEAHASLVLTYLELAKIHKSAERNMAFTSAIESAIEELKILLMYSPKDPWVHAQLAACYHDLNKRDEEIAQYEHILSLRSNDQEVMYRLGILYFQQGQNAKGFKIYEQLKSLGSIKHESLLQYYDAYMKSIFPLNI